MSIRLPDLANWPLPPHQSSARENVRLLSPMSHTWELMHIHLLWLEDCTIRYGFDNVDETLRHLIYLSNSEPIKNKRLIFRIKRCLHCHVGARGGQHPKVSLTASVHQFQWLYLQNVTDKCGIASVEKCVRIICDFYQSRVKEAANTGESDEERVGAGRRREREIFGTRRLEDERFAGALSKWDSCCERKDREKQQSHLDMKDLADDPAACSEQASISAMARCQVGRGSASYAVAVGESVEETEARRAKERVIEESEEGKKNRAFIHQVLFM
mmetsp:Transcript_34322/g.67505  ORF Transcript_34322/g.67505 Transcript_34322/m.67505 type:complete len:272 (-) Transcript_34322:67-882(-)